MARKILPPNVNQLASSIKNKMVVGRVKDIILDPFHPKFKEYGSFNSIGTIFFEENQLIGSSTPQIAKPFFAQSSYFPLVNELVLLFSLPNKRIGKSTSNESYYYINIINIWNSQHHNGYPNPTSKLTPPSQQKDYDITDKGSPIRRIDSNGTGLNFNAPGAGSQQTFIERQYIHPLYPFTGDVLYQGRWGNSIRFGSTTRPFNTADYKPLNEWSDIGENGDPIITIRNGQSPTHLDEKGNPLAGYIPITEQINNDLSSIYLTSTQKLKNFKIQNSSFFSYPANKSSLIKTPTLPKDYIGSQVIINSDRLVFNAKKDHILISGQESINLSSNNSLNFDTTHFIIASGQIKLGSPDAKEPLVKGEILREDLFNITKALINITTILEVSKLWPAGAPVADPTLSMTAVQVKDLLNNILEDFEKDSNGKSAILSEVSKTI